MRSGTGFISPAYTNPEINPVSLILGKTMNIGFMQSD